MDGETFYELFKEALNACALEWNEKEKMQVTIGNDFRLIFGYEQGDVYHQVKVKLNDTRKKERRASKNEQR